MSMALVVLILGLVGLVLTAVLLVREPDVRIRLAAGGGAIGGFLLALLLALAAGISALGALATASLSAAVLALVLVGQWRFVRSLFARQGRKL